VSLPDCVELEVGACLGIPALTAWHAVMMDGGVVGKTVLIAGGAGAVGHYAVQLAKLKGAACVIATVSTAGKAELARAAGADVIINYRSEDVSAACREATAAAGIDRIIEVDFAANVGTDFAIVRPEGDIVVYGSGAPAIPVPFISAITKNVRLRFFMVYNLTASDRAAAIADLTTLMTANRLVHNIAARLPLTRIAEADELVEHGRATGNVVLDVNA